MPFEKRLGPRESGRQIRTKSRTRSGCSAPAAAMPKEVTRSIPVSVQCLLWGKAAGRCEFSGCNQPLWKSSVTQEQINIAEKAHIYSFSGEGARGNTGVAADTTSQI